MKSSAPLSDQLAIIQVDDINFATKAADFFAANVDISYISHGEVMQGRATDFSSWSHNLKEIFATDAREAILNARLPCAEGLHLAVAFYGSELAGLALYEYVHGSRNRYAVLQDIVISRHMRGKSLGSAMLGWLEEQFARCKDIRQIFLESGKENHMAHLFFEHHGYSSCSIVMSKFIRNTSKSRPA